MNTLEHENIFQKPFAIVLLALSCCALWGSAFPAIKVGYRLFDIQTTGSQILFAGYRFFLAGIMTLIIASISEKKFVKIKMSSFPFVLGQGILQTTIQYVCFYIGLSNTTGVKGSVINGSNAFFSIIAAHFLMKNERITWKKSLGCVLGFAGVIVINLQQGGLDSNYSFLGEGLVLLCSFAYGLSSVTLKMISDRETPNSITAYQLLLGSAILIVMGILGGGHISGFTFESTLLLLYLSLLSTISFCLWANLLKHNPVGKIAIFGFCIPIFGAIMSSAFLNESILSFTNIAALILISTGIIMANRT